MGESVSMLKARQDVKVGTATSSILRFYVMIRFALPGPLETIPTGKDCHCLLVTSTMTDNKPTITHVTSMARPKHPVDSYATPPTLEVNKPSYAGHKLDFGRPRVHEEHVV